MLVPAFSIWQTANMRDNTFMDPLLAYRPQFPILAKSTYMISHSRGMAPSEWLIMYVDFARMGNWGR